MSDKVLGIQTQMEISDVQSGLNDLLGLFDQIPDSITTDINLGGDAEGNLNTIGGELDTLNNTQLAIPVDTSEIVNLGSDANTTSSDIEGMGTAADSASSEIQDAMSAADESINTVGSDATNAGSNISDMGSGAGTDTGAGTSTGGGLGGDLGAAVGGIIGLSTLTEAQNQLYDTNITIDKISTETGIAKDKMTDWVYAMTDAHFPVTDAENYMEVLNQLGVPNEKLVENAKAMNEIQIGTGASSASTRQFAADIDAMGGDINNLSQYYGMAQYAQDNVVGGMDAFATDAKMLGPRLKDMGFTAEESAVIIGNLSQKNAGNIRGMRKDLTDAHGSATNLMNILGTTKGQVDQTSSSFTGLAGSTGESAQKLEHHATVTRNNTSATQDLTDKTDHAKLATGSWAGELLGAIIPLGFLTVGVGLLSRALSKLKPEMTPSLWNVYWDMWKNAGETIVNTIKGWLPKWGTEAEKSAQGTFKALESGVTEGEKSFTSKIKDFGGKVGDTIKGWKPSWGPAAENGVTDMVKTVDGTWVAKSPGILTKIRGFGSQIYTGLSEGISTKLPSIEGIGGKIPEGLGSGITKALPKLAGDAALPLTVVTLGIQGVYSYTDTLKTGPIGNMLSQWGLSLPAPLKKLDDMLSPEHMLSAIIGPGPTKWIEDGMEKSVNTPIKNALNPIPGEITGWLKDVPGNIEKPFNDAGDFLKNLPGNMYNWGKGIIGGLGKGITDAIPDLGGALKQVEDLFPHSPPKSGPLANIKESEMESWMSGIASAGMKGFSKFNLHDLSLPSMPNLPGSMGMVSSPTQLNITIDLTGLPAGTTPEQAKNIGNNIGVGIASNDILKGFISNGGRPNSLLGR